MSTLRPRELVFLAPKDLSAAVDRLVLTRWFAGGMVLGLTLACVRALAVPLPEAPLLLLGYNYPSLAPGWRIVWMSVVCILLTAILAWVRQRSRSVWPAAIGHGTENAGLALTALMLGASPDLRTASASLMGWAGWPVGIALAAWLLWRRALRPWRPSRAKETQSLAP